MPDQSVTLATATSASGGIKIERLSAEQTRQTGFTHRWRIPFDVINNAAWTAQGDTITVTLGSTPTRFLVDKAAYVVTTAFANTPTGTLTLQVGTDGDPDNFIDAQDAKTAAVILADTSATVKTEVGSMGIASDVLVARFTTEAATSAPANITAGSVDILLSVRDLNDIVA
jgi:hypothetical protein